MAGHIWVEMKYTPIKAHVNDQGRVETHADEISREVAESEKVMGCWVCDLPLNEDTINSECNPSN